jgi:hypothetical protein
VIADGGSCNGNGAPAKAGTRQSHVARSGPGGDRGVAALTCRDESPVELSGMGAHNYRRIQAAGSHNNGKMMSGI